MKQPELLPAASKAKPPRAPRKSRRAELGDPVVESASYRGDVGAAGPCCYLCGRAVDPAKKTRVAVGPGQTRARFAIAAPDADSVIVGGSCLRRVPLASIFARKG